MRVFHSIDELVPAVGTELGTSDWLMVDQERVDTFADATGDHQWIHVDPQRAAEGPFGGTIAHGYLTLSLLPPLLRQVYRVEGGSMTVNYGLNRVRFSSPLRVGSRIRGTARLASATSVSNGLAVQVELEVTIEVEGVEKPACVATSVIRYFA
ncbi:MaoC family dehydratase [Rhodococcus sp. USK13]|uniref:MaoC family dehydratase n=1 Tax=Rhodococcus sp. USK13 TaxID=2806442 RepID=UPI001BCEC4A3|nr:MaoC family dehydratase [Rhodococcus sp. USK13]